MPDLGEISRSYDSGEFQIIGLISDVTETGDSKAQEIVQSTQADYTHLVASPDIQRKVLSRVSVVPTTYLWIQKETRWARGMPGAVLRKSGLRSLRICEARCSDEGEKKGDSAGALAGNWNMLPGSRYLPGRSSDRLDQGNLYMSGVYWNWLGN